MFDKTIGVIPPRNELSSFSDKKTENFKEDFAQKKSEFESHMTQLKKKDPDRALGGTKKKVADDEMKEPRLEKKLARETEKPIREEDEDEEIVDEGEEKKVSTVNAQMVLINMASPESVIKIPETEVNLDDLEKTELTEILTTPALTMEAPVEGMAAAIPIQAEAAPEGITAQPAAPAFEEMLELAPAEAPMAPVATEAPVAVDSKVLEALNRDQHFQKLETMVAPEMEAPAKETIGTAPVQSEIIVETQKMNEFAVSGPDMNAKSEKQFDQDDRTDAQASMETPQAVPAHQPKDFARAVSEIQTAAVTDPAMKSNDSANVKEILNQAQYLVTQGGGEVSVKMSPEGMGEVHLKVMLDNGKMSVEMNTQDKNVQKLIQDSLSDLKSSLAAHQISVEHVTLNNKMSSVETLQKSNDSRSFSDSSANNFANNPQHGQERDNRQQASRVFDHETSKAVPVAKTEINKAVAQRVYQMNTAQGLNAVA